MFKKSMLGVAVLGAMAFNATAVESLTMNVDPLASFSVLPINDTSKSFVINKFEANGQVASLAPMRDTTVEDIANIVAKHDAVLLDAQYFQGQDDVISTYLTQAHAQNKTIIIENARALEENALEGTFTAMVDGDIVVIHPTNNAEPEVIYVYDAQKRDPVADSVVLGSDKANEKLNSLAAENVYAAKAPLELQPLVPEMTLNSMSGEQREKLLTQVVQNLRAEKSNGSVLSSGSLLTKKNASKDGVIASAGGVPYSCAQELYDARKCRTYTIRTIRYDYDYQGITISGLTHADYTMFKDRNNKFVAVQFNGIATPTLSKNQNDRREYWLNEVEIDVNVYESSSYAYLDIYDRRPVNDNNETQLTSTTGLSIGIDTSAGTDSSSIAASATYEVSNSVTQSIKDWEVIAHSPQNRDINWRYFSRNPPFPGTNGDWSYNPGAFKKMNLVDVNTISRYGLDYSAEVVYLASPTESRLAAFDVHVDFKNTSTYFISRGISAIGTEVGHLTYDHDGGSTFITLDMSWLN